jgi:hypothetical protein
MLLLPCCPAQRDQRQHHAQAHQHNCCCCCCCCPCALQNAFKSYVRTRDYCTTPKHIITMCLNAVRVAVEMNNFMHVSNYVSKAEQTPGTKV